MVEYRETFLDKMKALLPYFIEFNKDESILLKDYPKNCAISSPNKKPIIMITNNKNTFLTNNSQQKV